MMKQGMTLGVAMLLVAVAAVATLTWKREMEGEQGRQLQQIVAQHALQPLERPPRQDPALVALGKTLFSEPELSGNRDVSCATCHDPALGTTDGLPLSIGTGGSGLGPSRQPDPERRLVARNAIALFNSGLPGWNSLFWDGRVERLPSGGYVTPAGRYLPPGLSNVLAAQGMFPVILRDEMRGGWYDVAGYAIQPGTPADGAVNDAAPGGWHDVDINGEPNELAAIANGEQHMPQIWSGLMARLLAMPEYRRLFAAAYPGVSAGELGFKHAANALAAFQTEAFTVLDSPWDRYLAGEADALAAEAVAGALLFYGEAGCAACHSGTLFSDQAFHNIGAPQFGPGRDEDAPLDYGRWHVTGDEQDRFAFRTPPLRNVTRTGPWLHNGAYDSLEDVVRHHLDPEAMLRAYDGSHLPLGLGTTLQNEPVTMDAILRTLDPLLQNEGRLSGEEIGQIVAFLEALEGGEIGD